MASEEERTRVRGRGRVGEERVGKRKREREGERERGRGRGTSFWASGCVFLGGFITRSCKGVSYIKQFLLTGVYHWVMYVHRCYNSCGGRAVEVAQVKSKYRKSGNKIFNLEIVIRKFHKISRSTVLLQ